MITFQTEKLDEVKDDIIEIMQRHGEEFTYHKDKKGEVAPNWELGILIDSMDRLCICTARDDNELIGYFVFYLTPLAHYRNVLAAFEDTFYLLPEYRSKGIGYRFIKYSVQKMKDSGATMLKVTNKSKSDYKAMWERLGFEQEEIVYTQVL